jgi:hypothetical protein
LLFILRCSPPPFWVRSFHHVLLFHSMSIFLLFSCSALFRNKSFTHAHTHTHTHKMEKLSSHVMLEETFWCGAISLYSVSLLLRFFLFLCNTWQTKLKLPRHTHKFLFFFQKEIDATSCRVLFLIFLWVESKITKYIATVSVIQFRHLRRIISSIYTTDRRENPWLLLTFVYEKKR